MKTTKVITPYFEDGAFAGVRVCIGDEDFIIAPNDYREGEQMTWPEAMDALEADNLSTWDYRQICITMAYREEIDKVLEDNGRYCLDEWYWTRTDTVHSAFSYFGFSGSLEITSKHNFLRVRLIKNLKEE